MREVAAALVGGQIRIKQGRVACLAALHIENLAVVIRGKACYRGLAQMHIGTGIEARHAGAFAKLGDRGFVEIGADKRNA